MGENIQKKENAWFKNALKVLNVDQESGWPDRFGVAIEKRLRGKKVSTLSLFTGAGGLDIGFHTVGFHSKEMVEIEKNFVTSLSENTGKGDLFEGSIPKCIDIKEYNPPPDLEVDFIVGGPPCQTFSSAGRRASGVMGTDDPRGMLFSEYVRLLKKMKPKGFLFENVYGITGAQGGEAWKSIKLAFEEAGYTLFYRVLDAADYGVPQHRERLFIVGLKKGKFKFPLPTHGPDSQDKRPHYSAGVAVKTAPRNEELKLLNGRYGHLLDGIPPGLNYSYYTKKMGHPEPVFAWRSKFSDFLYKADPDFPVRAIKAQGGQYTGPFSWESRYFTISEMKRLQTFPDNFRLQGGRQVAVHQIGNSIPPQIGRILGLAILDQVFNVQLPFEIDYMPDDFELSFRKMKRLKSNYYEDKAKEAISKIPKKKAREISSEKTKITRYLGPKFEWSDSEKKDYKKVDLVKQIKDKVLEISIDGRKRKKFTITISPEITSDWHIPYEKIVLHSEGCELSHLTMLWKALEEDIKDKFNTADLVQLFGYYQYKPKTKTIFYFNSSDDKNFWNFVQRITEGTGSNEIDVNNLSLFELETKETLHKYLNILKGLGFEIRNSNTNPQIREGVYLIPYFFPTLTKDSVQLHKKL